MRDTVQIRVHKDLAKVIMFVRGEMMKKNKVVTVAQITKKMSKLLNTRELIN